MPLNRKYLTILLCILAAIVLLIAVVGCDIGGSDPTTTTEQTTTTAETTTTSTTTTTVVDEPPVQSVRLFGDESLWNTPADQLEVPENADEMENRFWVGHEKDTNQRGLIDIRTDLYGRVIHDASTATRQATIWIEPFFLAKQGEGNIGNKNTIPWNDNWVTQGDSDGLMAILDPATGQEIDLFRVNGAPLACSLNILYIFAGFKEGDLCVGSADLLVDKDNEPIDYRTYVEDGAVHTGGGGFPLAALTLRADEILSGSVDHALGVNVFASLVGPPCKPVRGDSDPGAGDSCNYFLPPASKIEHQTPPTQCGSQPAQANTNAARALQIPHGSRYRLDMSFSDVEEWVSTLPALQQRTGRIIAKALIEYGWIITDTGCNNTAIHTDSTAGPARETWARLGIGDDDQGVLHGLFTRERIKAVGYTPR